MGFSKVFNLQPCDIFICKTRIIWSQQSRHPTAAAGRGGGHRDEQWRELEGPSFAQDNIFSEDAEARVEVGGQDRQLFPLQENLLCPTEQAGPGQNMGETRVGAKEPDFP